MSSGMYDPSGIEKKWQDYWLKNKTFKAEIDHDKEKYYVLDMFPYPSGDGLHVGHPEGYTATDIVSRYKRMQGFNVLHPMGWDAFGLPAERHAMRTGEHPAIITNKNCDTFRRQIQELGLSYDWDREINTTDSKYVKWTQWIFKILHEQGLAYEQEVAVNFCPALGTVLANEEVKDGKYVETGDPVEKRPMKQWMLRITAYAERLIDDLDGLDWPEGIKAMQRDWIGRSEGADVTFKVANSKHEFLIFTTRPDTLFGATYCVLAPEHSLVTEIVTDDQRAVVEAYAEKSAKISARDRMKEGDEKSGVFTGAYATNPVNGEQVPIWVADYVLAEYGYGAIMAVPAHDQRDYDFAKKFDIPIIQVIDGGDISDQAHTGNGKLVNSEFLDGLEVKAAISKTNVWLEEQGVGQGTINYKLRDWLFARQRYWGEPFPLVELEDGTVKTVPLKDLPILLPDMDEYKPTDDGQPPLARATDWVNTTDEETGQAAKRNTNTMPQWAGSCWYFLRFCDPTNDDMAWSKEAEEYWMPVDLYVGGAEHAVLHLLYSRFWHKVLFDAGYVSTNEPFQKLYNQGMILAEAYQSENGKYFYPEEVKEISYKHLVNEQEQISKTYIENIQIIPRGCGLGSYRYFEPSGRHYNGETEEMPESMKRVRPITIGENELLAHEIHLEDGVVLHGKLGIFYESGNDGKAISNNYITDTADFDRLHSCNDLIWENDAGEFFSNDYVKISTNVYSENGTIWEHQITNEVLDVHLRLNNQIGKMGKSIKNVVNPDDVIKKYGADSMRLYEMFMGPLDRDKPWTDEGVQGVNRFLKRAWALFITEDNELQPRIQDAASADELVKSLHSTIKAVTHNIEHYLFNTAIARMMEFVNAATRLDVLNQADAEAFVLILAPFAPHMAEELWERLGHKDTTLAYVPWPTHDEALLVETTIEIPVQVNGKMRGRITVPADADQATVVALAKADGKVAPNLEGKTVVKEIVIPGKMINLVVK